MAVSQRGTGEGAASWPRPSGPGVGRGKQDEVTRTAAHGDEKVVAGGACVGGHVRLGRRVVFVAETTAELQWALFRAEVVVPAPG